MTTATQYIQAINEANDQLMNLKMVMLDYNSEMAMLKHLNTTDYELHFNDGSWIEAFAQNGRYTLTPKKAIK